MKFIELTYEDCDKNFIIPLTEDMIFEQRDKGTMMVYKDTDILVKESLAEIEQKICRLGGDVA